MKNVRFLIRITLVTNNTEEAKNQNIFYWSVFNKTNKFLKLKRKTLLKKKSINNNLHDKPKNCKNLALEAVTPITYLPAQ